MAFPDASAALAALASRQATLEDLREIVVGFPELRPVVAAYPGTDDALIGWLRALHDPLVDQQLDKRGGAAQIRPDAPTERIADPTQVIARPVQIPSGAPTPAQPGPAVAPVYTPVPPEPPHRQRRVWPIVVIVVAALVLVGGGVGIALATGLFGGGTQNTPSRTRSPRPSPSATVPTSGAPGSATPPTSAQPASATPPSTPTPTPTQVVPPSSAPAYPGATIVLTSDQITELLKSDLVGSLQGSSFTRGEYPVQKTGSGDPAACKTMNSYINRYGLNRYEGKDGLRLYSWGATPLSKPDWVDGIVGCVEGRGKGTISTTASWILEEYPEHYMFTYGSTQLRVPTKSVPAGFDPRDFLTDYAATVDAIAGA